MKKLLMLGAILVLGATAFAEDANIDGKANEAEADVTVKAKLVAENLVITDLEGRQIILDFGRVSKTRDKGTSEAKTGYMVRYVGTGTLNADTQDLAMSLLNEKTGSFDTKAVPVTMSEVTKRDGFVADTFKVSVGLNSYAGKMQLKAEDGHDYPEYIGIISGTLDHNKNVSKPVKGRENGAVEEGVSLSALNSGDYEGLTKLKVTINGGDDF